MTIIQEPGNEDKPTNKPSGNRFILTGLSLLFFGIMLIAERVTEGAVNIFISWEIVLIIIGIYIGEKSNFKNVSWIILVLIGGFFLLDDFIPALNIRYFIGPVFLILGGAYLILRPKNVKFWKQGGNTFLGNENTTTSGPGTSEDYIDSVSIFGGVTKNIMNKSFKGGEAVSIFGGTEINLSQADIQGIVILELTQIMGGSKLIIPPNWDLKSEVVNIFGGVEDKRPFQNIQVDTTKVLLLKGTSIFGGIEIKSY
ncbi:MAG: LiaF transmembrane domain-containing protein [Chitinophagales bacterium]